MNPNAMERYLARARTLAESDPEIRDLAPDKSVQKEFLQPGLSMTEIIAVVLRRYAERSALRERHYDLVAETDTTRMARCYVPAFDTITYCELCQRIEALASAWRRHEHHRVDVDDCVCILGFTGIDFAVADMATAYVQAVTVPLQSTLGAEHLENIFRDTAPATVVATISDLELATQLAIKTGVIRSILAIDYDPRVDADRSAFETAQGKIENAGAAIYLTSIDALIEFGRAYAWTPLPPHAHGLDRMAGIIHSSGSTGTPKGIMLPERALNLGWLGSGAPQAPTVTTAYAPMNHFIGRHQVYVALAAGGTVYYTARPDLSTLFEDIRLSRPTTLFFFPRVFELIYQQYQSGKVRRISEGMGEAGADAQVRAEMRAGFLGNRLLVGTIGSAPCAPEVKAFVRDCFDILLIEGYGSTESGIQTTQNDRVARPPVIDYKLRDVPELGYYLSDKPYPRGELLIKSAMQALGIFKRPEETAALFDEDGYVITATSWRSVAPTTSSTSTGARTCSSFRRPSSSR